MKNFNFFERPLLDFIKITYIFVIMAFTYYCLIAIWHPNSVGGILCFAASICFGGFLGYLVLKQGVYQSQKIGRKKFHVINNPISINEIMQKRDLDIPGLLALANNHSLTIYEAKKSINLKQLGPLQGAKFHSFYDEKEDVKYLNYYFEKNRLFMDNDAFISATSNQVLIPNDELQNLTNEVQALTTKAILINSEKENLFHQVDILTIKLENAENIQYMGNSILQEFRVAVDTLNKEYHDNCVNAASVTKLVETFIRKTRIHTLTSLFALKKEMIKKGEIVNISEKSLRWIYNALEEESRATRHKKSLLDEYLTNTD